MELKTFVNTLKIILRTPQAKNFKLKGIFKHFLWQLRKKISRFPLKLKFSDSYLIINNSKIGSAALINAIELYDYNNMKFIKEILKSDNIFFDVGANIGVYTILASEQSKTKVYAFEPHPITYSYLLENVILNNRKNIVCNNIALINNKRTVMKFTNYDSNSINHIVLNEVNDDSSIEVSTQSGKQFCVDNNCFPDYMKIDVEGYELDVLISFEGILSQTKILFVETKGEVDKKFFNRTNEIYQYLNTNFGFQGPFYLNYNLKTFYKVDVNDNYEDTIFISKFLIDNKATLLKNYRILV